MRRLLKTPTGSGGSADASAGVLFPRQRGRSGSKPLTSGRPRPCLRHPALQQQAQGQAQLHPTPTPQQQQKRARCRCRWWRACLLGRCSSWRCCPQAGPPAAAALPALVTATGAAGWWQPSSAGTRCCRGCPCPTSSGSRRRGSGADAAARAWWQRMSAAAAGSGAGAAPCAWRCRGCAWAGCSRSWRSWWRSGGPGPLLSSGSSIGLEFGASRAPTAKQRRMASQAWVWMRRRTPAPPPPRARKAATAPGPGCAGNASVGSSGSCRWLRPTAACRCPWCLGCPGSAHMSLQRSGGRAHPAAAGCARAASSSSSSGKARARARRQWGRCSSAASRRRR